MYDKVKWFYVSEMAKAVLKQNVILVKFIYVETQPSSPFNTFIFFAATEQIVKTLTVSMSFVVVRQHSGTPYPTGNTYLRFIFQLIDIDSFLTLIKLNLI